MLLAVLFVVPVCFSEATNVSRDAEWQTRLDVYAGGHTYCVIGERKDAFDGVDVFDVPCPPFEPRGRCFVYIKQPSFPQPHNKLWMEWRMSHGLLRVWNLTLLYVPMNNEGHDVSIQWDTSMVRSSGYGVFRLIYDGHFINMKTSSSFSFYSGPYQMTSMRVVCGYLTLFDMG